MTKLRVTLPLDHPLAQDPRALIDWVLGFSLVKRGAFAAGSCGVAINHDEFVSSSLVRSAMEQRIAAVCRRYPGTDWNLPERAVRRLLRWDDAEDDIVHQFPRVSWLTLIGPFGVERFGGGEALRKALAIDPAVHIHSAGSGVVVQAGDMPRFGDPAGRDPLSAYRSAARALRRLRMPFLFGFGVDRGTWVDEWQQSLEAPTT